MILLTLCCSFLPPSPWQQAGTWEINVQIDGPEAFVNFGISMDSIGDLDWDGAPDLLVGALGSDWFGQGYGAAHVYSGAGGHRILSVSGMRANTAFGSVVARAGDLDADGKEDFLVGAHDAGLNFEGAVYVYSGAGGLLMHVVAGIPGSSSGALGTAVTDFEDWNRDGFDDFIVGDSYSSILPQTLGFGWLISGRDFSVLHTIIEPGWLGTCGRVESLSDLTGDGHRELLITENHGVHLLSGSDFAVIRTHVPPVTGSLYGHAMAEIGDLDGDVIPDYVLGAPGSTSIDPGHAYVHSGGTGVPIASLQGPHSDSWFGWSCLGPGDVDGDGYPEILIGAFNERFGQNLIAGAAHLYSGHDLQEIHVFSDSNSRLMRAGVSLAEAGDLDSDGLPEFRIGSYSSHPPLPSSGVIRTLGLHSFLALSTRWVSAAVGGAVDFAVDFPDSVGGLRYAILASSGPGRTLIRGERIPLNATPLLNLSLHAPPLFFPGAQGTLDAAGDASATLTLAPHAAAGWAGRTLKFSAVALDPTGAVQAYSAAMPLAVEP